ncbi:hypothetical protein Ae201684P_012372 [Aphanomyces euteiches]|nr:hypothetical protein Ae201684P_012372 [Aphanomyces euteiches]
MLVNPGHFQGKIVVVAVGQEEDLPSPVKKKTATGRKKAQIVDKMTEDPYISMVKRHRSASKRVHEWFQRYTSQDTSLENSPPTHPLIHPRYLWQVASIEFSPLHEACRVGDVEALDAALRSKCCRLYRTHAGQTPLHVAVTHRHLMCVSRLLEEADASIQMHARDFQGRTAIHLAFQRRRTWKHRGLMDTLFNHASPSLCQLRDNDGWSIQDLDFLHRGDLIDAVAAGQLDRIQYLQRLYNCNLFDQQQSGRTLLHEACEQYQLEVVRYLLANGIDSFVEDLTGATVLHVCARRGFLEGCVIVLDPSTSLALLTAQDKSGRTPLHWSLLRGHHAVSMYFIQTAAMHGVAYELLATCDDHGYAPLHLASASGHIALVKSMIYLGADVNSATTTVRQRIETSPLVAATQSLPGNNRPRSAFNATSLKDVSQHTVELKTLRLLTGDAANASPTVARIKSTVGPIDTDTPSPLVLALRSGHIDVADVLLENGADLATGEIWELYMTNSNTRQVLAPLACFWLSPPAFAVDEYAELCRCRRWNEEALCALLELATSLCLLWENLDVAMLTAFQRGFLELAHRLHAGRAAWVLDPPLSWLSLAVQSSKPLESCQWLQKHYYPIRDADSSAIFLLLKQPFRQVNLAQVTAFKARSTTCIWLLTQHFYPPSLDMQAVLDVALRGGYTDVAKTLLSSLPITPNIPMDVVDAFLDNNALLGQVDRMPWLLCDEGLAWACRRNSVFLARRLLAHGAKPQRYVFVHGKSALLWAVWHRNVEILKLLDVLDDDIMIQASDSRGRDALYIAMRTNDPLVVAFLWSSRHHTLFNLEMALFAAVEANAATTLAWLANAEPTLNLQSIQDSTGRTLVHVACERGYLALATWLAPPETWHQLNQYHGHTPGDILRLFGHDVPEPLQPFSPPASTLYGVLRCLLSDDMQGLNEKYRPFTIDPLDRFSRMHAACCLDSLKHVQHLAAHGISLVDPQEPDTYEPILWAAPYGAQNVTALLVKQRIQDSVLEAALYYAARYKHIDVIWTLLSVATTASVGRLAGDCPLPTLLHWVAAIPQSEPLMAELLDKFQAQIEDRYGITPIMFALVAGNLSNVLYLLKRGARLEAEFEGQSIFYYVLHLVPSETWRVFLQAFLVQRLQRRGLHCVEEFCGCKSFEATALDESCSFCCHAADKHIVLPLPPWHQDVNDTYKRQTSSQRSSRRSNSRQSSSGDMFSHELSDTEPTTDAFQPPEPPPEFTLSSVAPSPPFGGSYVGRLSRDQVYAIARIQFQAEMTAFDLRLEVPERSELAQDNEIDEDKDAFSMIVVSSPEATPCADHVEEVKPVDFVRVSGTPSASHDGCWCTQAPYCRIDPSFVRLGVINSWVKAPKEPPSIKTLQQVWAKWKEATAPTQQRIVPRDAQQLVRLKLAVLHWRLSRVLQAFCRWKVQTKRTYTRAR